MSARIHMAGSCDLQMLKDAYEGMKKQECWGDYTDTLRYLIDALDDDLGSSRTWSVTADEFYAIRESAKRWNLNKFDY